MTFFKTSLTAFCALSLWACNDAPDANTTASVPDTQNANTVPHAQLPGNVVPSAYRIDLRMNPDDAGMSGHVAIDVDIAKATQKIWLHGKNINETSAVLVRGENRTPLTYQQVPESEAPSGVAFLASSEEIPAGKAIIEIDYTTPYNMALNSAYKVSRDDEHYIVTQFEPLGAREAFPGFDEPKYKVPFTLSITSPAEDVVYANTPEIKATTEDDGWIRHDFATTRPLPTYLVAFGAGPYDINDYGTIPPNSIRKTPLELRGFTAKGQGDEITYGLKHTDGILTALEEYFGTPYPYEKLDLIAAPEYAFGAMENPGAIVYREYLMLMDEDSALTQKRSYARVHSHELAHQWFGNLVTPVWWEDIWLNEAFATWMGNKATAIWQPEGNYDRNTLNASLGAMNIDTLATTRKVREPLARSENVMNQFDGITYRKGGGVLSMFESYLGEDAFRTGVRLHMDRYQDDVASADDFFQSIADGSKNDKVVSAMKSFVDQPGLPLVETRMSCEDGKTELTFSQSRYAPLGSKTKQGQTWEIPVCAKLGVAGETVKHCELLTEKKMTSKITLESCPAWITPNENGSGYYRFSLDNAGWSALLSNLDALNTREHLTILDSLKAAFSAGKVDASVFLEGMEIFATSKEHDVASKAGDWISWFHDYLPETSRDDIARLTQDMYAKRYTQIVGKDTVEGNLLAPTLAARLITYGQDEKLEADFAQKGRNYLAGDKKAVAPNMLSRALRAAMKSGNMGTAEKLLNMAKDGSSFEKGAAIGALAQTKDKNIAAMLLDTALVDDETITGRQANSLVFSLLGSDEFGDMTWDWLKSNFKLFVDTRVPDVRKGGMPGTASGFCTLERRDEAKAFFEKSAAVIPGYERSLLQTVESIELCAALKSAKADEVAAALAARP
ncbi:MAG: M1 family metallopeptidase [Maricaulaceae bacterium]